MNAARDIVAFGPGGFRDACPEGVTCHITRTSSPEATAEIAVARALALDPDFIVADEPCRCWTCPPREVLT